MTRDQKWLQHKGYVNTTKFDTELTTKTTIGILACFWSYVHKYFITGNLESLELPIFSHKNESGTFKGGDSGSLIISPLGQFVGLLTSTNKGMHGSNITFATLFKWVWELACNEFLSVSLHFEDLQVFFTNVA
ncbi:hypothetical protein DXG03_009093 [Asterophora parasitica]|uniref:Uncharacterized protein n=1 Tax=Asterophora parasitica TaxID=117018 RepID=A0A9P7G072_9AGAR|nr:hypothetical protein DXG03_009093 [Asterophora parasitica]